VDPVPDPLTPFQFYTGNITYKTGFKAYEYFTPLSKKRRRWSVYKWQFVILWHIDPMLGDNREINSYTSAVAK
jgi:hypothetical protein